MRFGIVIAVLCAIGTSTAHSDIRGCVCHLANPQTAAIRACSLCMEAEKQPPTTAVFLLRDANPTKPNRWLALPRAAYDGVNPLAQMPPAERTALWKAAIAKAKEVWGDQWGIAMNGDISRTQCHAHLHIGKLLSGQEPGDGEPEAPKRAAGQYVAGPDELPSINDGAGLWFHPVEGRLHVHIGEQITETVLLR